VTRRAVGDWFETTIGEQATLQRGFDITKKDMLPGLIPVYSSGGINGYHNEAQVAGPGVVMGRKGTLGTVFYIEEDFWPHDTTLWVKDFHGNVPRFVCYFFKSMAPRLLSLDVGSANPTLNRNHVHPIPISWPSRRTQESIAHILGTLDDKIELNRRMNRTLEAIALAIFKSWFVNFDPVHAKAEGREPVGMDPETATLFPDSFQDSPLGKIPKGWEIRTVDGLCEQIENGGTPKRKQADYWGGGIPWFKTGELSDGPLIESGETISRLGLDESSCKLWPPRTILIALYASPTVGRLGILEIPASANQACSALQAKSAYGAEFLFHSLLSTRGELQRVAVGAAQQNISQQIVRDHKLVAPPPALASAFTRHAASLRKTEVSYLRESRTLVNQRDGLLPKLLSGQLKEASDDRCAQQ